MTSGMDFSWLSSLFASNPSLIQPGQDPSMWQPQPMPAGQPVISPEMGSGVGRQIDLATVDALGPKGRNVNAASSVAAGGQPSMGDRLADAFGSGAPGGLLGSDGGKEALKALVKLAPLLAQRDRRQQPGLLPQSEPVARVGLLAPSRPPFWKREA